MPRQRADHWFRAAALGVPILVGGAAHAASVTLDFDTLADGTSFVAPSRFIDTTPLRDEFAAHGVRFTGGGGVLSGSFGVAGTSGPNFLAFNARSAARYGDGSPAAPPEQVHFDRPANLVRLRVASPEGGSAALTAFDAAGNVIATGQLALAPTAQPLEVQSPQYNIVAVELTATLARTVVADDLVVMLQDDVNLPPVTECTLACRASANGWYHGDVLVTLTAEDPDGVVVATHCRLDGGEWQPYSEPVLVTGEGVHTFEYQSLDEDGTWEDVKAETFKIDAGEPALQLSLSRSVIWPPNGQLVPVVVNGSAADSGSGVVQVVFEVKDEYGEVQPVLSAFGETIQLRAGVKPKDWNGRLYCVTAKATDEAGWTACVSRWVLVPRFWCPTPKKVAAVKHERKLVAKPKPVVKPKPVAKAKKAENSKKLAPPKQKVVVSKKAEKQKAPAKKKGR